MTRTHALARRTRNVVLCAGGLGAALLGALALGQDRVPQAGDDSGWIRDDIDAAYALAEATGKPLLVGFR